MAEAINCPNSTFSNSGAGNQFVAPSIAAENVVIGSLSKDEQDERLLSRLPYAAKATSNHASRQDESLCMPGTRTQVLSDIMAWARGESGDGRQRIYWLNGMAGTGKSTIARTVARACLDAGRLGASFFFSRGGGELETARMFVTTLAVQLARLELPCRRALRTAICDAVRHQPDIAQLALIDQWQRLVLRPCERMRAGAGAAPGAPPLVIVVDALDECHAVDEIRFVLALLSQTSGLAMAGLRVFLTSRPEILIREGFLDMPESARRHLVLHHIDPLIVGQDIRIFFERSLAKMIPHGPLLPGVSDDVVLTQLEHRAAGLFVWAATACRFIEEGGRYPRKRLEMILKGELLPSGNQPELKLDEMYTSILRNAVPDDDEKESFCQILRTVLGTIAISFSSLSVPSLASLLSLPDHIVLESLHDLHSIIDVHRNEPIRLQHASVRDFFLDNRRCSDACFRVDELEAHAHFAQQCLTFMDKKLKKNICRLDGPGVLTKTISQDLMDEHVPQPLRYACLYWVQHIQQSQMAKSVRHLVHNFFELHFLHWLEVVGVIGRMSEAVDLLTLLGTLYDDETSRLGVIIADAKRFILGNRLMIGEAPLQAYHSALAFAPTRSIIRQTYENELPQWLTQLPKIQADWSPHGLSLEGHRDSVVAVAFSPDKRLLASGSVDKTVRLWDITTGAARGTLEGHSAGVNVVEFSPDGRLLASASWDKTVRLWSATTGTTSGVLEGHLGHISSLAFSSDGRLLASASRDSTIRLWRAESGAACGTLKGHNAGVACAVFLPDNPYLVSAGLDGAVIVWNLRNMSLDRTVNLAGATDWKVELLRCMAMSSNGRVLAVGSLNRSISLWDTMTGAAIGNMSDKNAFSLAFSPNGRFLASTALGGAVTLWNVKETEVSSIVNDHSAYTAVFSRDEQFFALGSSDGTTRLVNFDSSTAETTCNSGAHKIRSLHFSADGSLLASGLDDGTLNLLDVKTDTVCATWKGQSNATVAFSPDSRLLAFVSDDRHLMLGDVQARGVCFRMVGHAATISDVVFSPNGKTIASASYDTKVKLWNARTMEVWRTLRGHSDCVTSVAFSPDSGIVASGSFDKTVRLWHIDSGAVCNVIKGHSSSVSCLAFSPDGSLFGSASTDFTIRIWRPRTGEQTYIIRNSSHIHWLKFAASGRIITTNNSADLLPAIPCSAPAAHASSVALCVLALRDRWLTCNLKNILWIPPQYRCVVVATSDQAIALGLESGEVVIMSFDFSRDQPWEDMTALLTPKQMAIESPAERQGSNVEPRKKRQTLTTRFKSLLRKTDGL